MKLNHPLLSFIHLWTFYKLLYFLHLIISSTFRLELYFFHVATLPPACLVPPPSPTAQSVGKMFYQPFLTFFTFCLTKCFDIRQCVPFPSLYSLQNFCLQDFHSSYCSHFPLLILYFSIWKQYVQYTYIWNPFSLQDSFLIQARSLAHIKSHKISISTCFACQKLPTNIVCLPHCFNRFGSTTTKEEAFKKRKWTTSSYLTSPNILWHLLTVYYS